jgi:hypothetical protein
MAEKCRCGSSAHGKVGMVPFCRPCIARLTHLPAHQFRKPVRIQLYDGASALSETLWIPWSFMRRDVREVS